MRLYRKLSTDIVDLEAIMYCNLLVFAAFSLYKFKSGDHIKRIVLSHISTAMAFLLLIVIVFFPVIVYFKNKYNNSPSKKPKAQTTQVIEGNDCHDHLF